MLNQYKEFISTIHRESDFYEFWDQKINELKNKELVIKNTETTVIDNITRKSFLYNSIDDKLISGNLFIPQNYNENNPVIVMYHGLGANTFGMDYFDLANRTWLNSGFIVAGFDVRGQNGKSEIEENEIFSEYGLYCRNILDKNNFYYVKTYLDGIRLLDCLETFEETKNKDIVCNGGSQGGAITLAVTSLDKRVKLAFADIPSNSHIRYMIETNSGGFANINKMVKENIVKLDDVLKTVSYVDTCNLVSLINVPVLCSVGALDRICPPEGFYQAYRQILSEKQLEIYEGYAHGGFDTLHFPKKLEWIKKYLNK